MVAGFGGIGGGGGKGNDPGKIEPSPESKPTTGKGGGGGGKGGTDKLPSFVSVFDDDATLLADASGKGILGPEYQKNSRILR